MALGLSILGAAAPGRSQVITGVSPSLWADTPFEIFGSAFGVKPSVAPTARDDLESGDFGPDWSYTGDLRIGARSRHPGSARCATLNMQGSLGESANKAYVSCGSDSSAPWFASFWFMLDENFDWGTSTYGKGDENLAAIKFFRMWSTGSERENLHLNAAGYGNTLSLSIEHIDSAGEGAFATGFMTDWTKGRWHCIQIEFLDSSLGGADGECRMWLDGRSIFDRRDLTTRKAGAAFKRPAIVGFYDAWNDGGEDRDDIYLDDFYVDNTWARVELGNAPVHDLCTHREIQPVTSWTNERLTIDPYPGAFTRTDEMWIFVTNAAGDVSAGYPAPSDLRAPEE